MTRTTKQSTEAAVREIRRKTRRKFAPEEKVRIVLEGLRGERNARERLPHYRKATRHEVPLDFEEKTPTKTRSAPVDGVFPQPARAAPIEKTGLLFPTRSCGHQVVSAACCFGTERQK
jgi:hypothetical protein